MAVRQKGYVKGKYKGSVGGKGYSKKRIAIRTRGRTRVKYA